MEKQGNNIMLIVLCWPRFLRLYGLDGYNKMEFGSYFTYKTYYKQNYIIDVGRDLLSSFLNCAAGMQSVWNGTQFHNETTKLTVTYCMFQYSNSKLMNDIKNQDGIKMYLGLLSYGPIQHD